MASFRRVVASLTRRVGIAVLRVGLWATLTRRVGIAVTRRVVGLASVGLGSRLRVGIVGSYASGRDAIRVGCWPRLRVGLGSRVTRRFGSRLRVRVVALHTRRLWPRLRVLKLREFRQMPGFFGFHITIWYSSGRAARTSRLSFFRPVGVRLQSAKRFNSAASACWATA